MVRNSQGSLTDWTFESLPTDLSQQLNVSDDPRHLSNVVRYWLLHKYGGLYLDHDVVPFRDLTTGLTPWTASIFGHREGSTMWFPEPGHPMLAHLVSEALVAPLSRSPHRSGAHLLHRIGIDYPDVGYEERVLPIDADGRRTLIGDIWAVHLWDSSMANN